MEITLETQKLIALIVLGVVCCVWLYLEFVHKRDGVHQGTKTYGKDYIITTKVFVKGEEVYGWVDSTSDEDEYYDLMEKREKEGLEKYKERTNQIITNK